MDLLDMVKRPDKVDLAYIKDLANHLPFSLRAQIINSYRRNLRKAAKLEG